MGRLRRERIYRNFSGGLNTEFGKLSFPENALTDALNVVLSKDGALSVRDGLDLTSADYYDIGSFSHPITAYVWRSAGGTDTDLLVLGVTNSGSSGPKLFFFSVDGSSTPANYVGELDLAEYTSGVYDGEPMQLAAVGSVLIAIGDCLSYPVYVVYRDDQILGLYDRDESQPTELQRGSYYIRMRVRDFADASSTIVDERPTELTSAHKYDLWNRGWPSKGVAISGFRQLWSSQDSADPIEYFARYMQATDTGIQWTRIPRGFRKDYFRTIRSTLEKMYPSKSDPYLGGSRSAYGRLDYRLYTNLKDPIGSVARGHFIVDAATYDRSAASGIEDLTGAFSTPARYRCVAGFAGRAWYAGSTEQSQAATVFYSQILSGEQYDNLAKCHQENDPTDPDINDVLATDGGTIEVEGAGRIMQLVPYSSSIVVLATNGVWEISGGAESGFTPTAVRVRKLSSDGVVSSTAGVLADSAVVYFARGGIYAVQADPTLGTLTASNISENTIQSFYKSSIPQESKPLARAVYDDYNRLVYWLYSDNDRSEYYYNKALVLDLRLNAFYPLEFSLSAATPAVVGAYLSPPQGVSTYQESVTVDGEDVTVDAETVYVVSQQLSTGFSDILFLALDPATNRIYQAAMVNRDPVDWAQYTDGVTYRAYAETGDDVVEDPSRLKDAVNMTAWFEITEDAVEEDDSGNLEFAHQSKCKFYAKWEWSDSAAGGQWHSQDNIYRLPVNYVPAGPTSPENFSLGYSVATVNRSINGAGRAVRFRFESYPGYGFKLLGLAVAFTIEEIN